MEKQRSYISLGIFNGIDAAIRNTVKKKQGKYLYCTVRLLTCRWGIKRISPLQGAEHHTMLSNSYISKWFLTSNAAHKHIICTDATSSHANPPPLAQGMPKSSLSWYWDRILEKISQYALACTRVLPGHRLWPCQRRTPGQSICWPLWGHYVLHSPSRHFPFSSALCTN